MHRITAVLASLLISAGGAVFARTHSWEGVHHLTVEEAAANFSTPPADFASHVIWGWEGPMDMKTIRHDLDSIKATSPTNTYPTTGSRQYVQPSGKPRSVTSKSG